VELGEVNARVAAEGWLAPVGWDEMRWAEVWRDVRMEVKGGVNVEV
jgi:hypothetical protein